MYHKHVCVKCKCVFHNTEAEWNSACLNCSLALEVEEELPEFGSSFSISINGNGISVKGASSKTIVDIAKNVGVSSKDGVYTGPMKPIDVTEFIKASNVAAKSSMSVLDDIAQHLSALFRELFGLNENQDMSVNLYAGISKERLRKIRKEIERELKPEMVKKITTQVTKEIRARDAKKLLPEDVIVAKEYFRDVELRALALNYVLSKRYQEYEDNFVKLTTAPDWWKTVAIHFVFGFVFCSAAFLLGIPLIAGIAASVIVNLFYGLSKVFRAYNASKIFNNAELKQIKDDLIESACLAQLARTSRTVSLLSVKNADDLHELINEVKADHYRLNSSAIDADEYEKALDSCRVRIEDFHDDSFMDRLKIRQAEGEAEAVEEQISKSCMFKS